MGELVRIPQASNQVWIWLGWCSKTNWALHICATSVQLRLFPSVPEGFVAACLGRGNCPVYPDQVTNGAAAWRDCKHCSRGGEESFLPNTGP